MKNLDVIFGHMEHGTFNIANDEYPIVIIHRIDERIEIDEDDIESYMDMRKHDSYLVPSQFNGEILFSKSFFKGLIV